MDKWTISELNIETPYYQKNTLYHKDKLFIDNEYLNHIKGNILDLGCGFSYKKILKQTNNYVGFDKDVKILIDKPDNLYIVDLNKEWNIDSQKEEFRSLYNYVPNISDFSKKHSDFDTVLCLNSLHYFVENIDILMNLQECFFLLRHKPRKHLCHL